MNTRERLHKLIPGGAHTYSRGDDQYPSNAPELLVRGEGAYVWDSQGRRFLDYGMGLRSVTVGYGFRRIADAACREILLGNNLPRPSQTELTAAEVITNLIPGADMVKFAKNGSTVTTAAVKLARAFTNRMMVAVCEDHPFFSYDDWFIGSTAVKRGIPEDVRGHCVKFRYNDLESLARAFSSHPDKIAAVIMEPARSTPPLNGFLQAALALSKRNGAVFILDEMITGFRWHLKGAQSYYGITPDLSTFGKGMANGFSVAAIVGKRDIMSLGGIQPAGSERVFLASSTHGAEMSGLGAFVETVNVYQDLNVVAHLWSYGEKLIAGVNEIAKDTGISDCFQFFGHGCSPEFSALDKVGRPSAEFRTLFLQEMVHRGVLMPWVAISYAHGDTELDMTLEAVREALKVYARALSDGINRHLIGPPVKPVFRSHN